jgi:hypothetical protein
MRVQGNFRVLGLALLGALVVALLGWRLGAGESAPDGLTLEQMPAVDATLDQGELSAAALGQDAQRERVEAFPATTLDAQEPTMHTVMIEGMVVHADAGTPIEGATVRMVVEGVLMATASTDAQGHYSATFRARIDGRRQVVAVAWAPGFGHDENIEWLTRAESMQFDFELSPGAVVRGLVEDAHGDPVEDCVVFWLVDGLDSVARTTDAFGKFSFNVDEPGPGHLVARHAQVGISPVTSFRIAADTIAEAPTLVLQSGGVLSGRVVNQQGRPIEKAHIHLHSKRWIAAKGAELESFESDFLQVHGRAKELYLEATGLAGAATATDKHGRFEILGIDPGTVRLTVQTNWHRDSFTFSTDSRGLELVVQHHTLLVTFTADDGMPMPGLEYRLSPVLPDGDPMAGIRLPSNIIPGKIPLLRYDVEPDQQYRLTASQHHRANAEFPRLRLIEAQERLINIKPSDDEVKVDMVLRRGSPEGILHLSPAWLEGANGPDAIVIEVLTDSGVQVLQHRHSSEDGWSVGVLPGTYEVRLKPMRYGQTRSGEAATDWAAAAELAFARNVAGAEFMRAPSEFDWSHAVAHRLQVSEALITEIPTVLPSGGQLLMVLRHEQGASGETQTRSWSGVGTLTLAGRKNSNSDALSFASELLRNGWPTEIEAAYKTKRGLEPGRWTWKTHLEGFEPIQVEFEIKPKCITTVVGILRPAR